MRILERCVAAWPMPEMEAQIDSLRLAFSANVHKPFELKSSFPYGSPIEMNDANAQYNVHYQQQLQVQPVTHPSVQRSYSYPHEHMTPSISPNDVYIVSNTSHQHDQYGMTQGIQNQDHRQIHQTPTGTLETPQQWNPTPILQQWHTAFQIPPSALAPPSASSSNSPPMPVPLQSQNSAYTQQLAQTPSPISPHSYHTPYPTTSNMHITSVPSQPQHLPTQQQQYTTTAPFVHPQGPHYVTPSAWQQSVASVYDPAGLKRRYEHTGSYDESASKRFR